MNPIRSNMPSYKPAGSKRHVARALSAIAALIFYGACDAPDSETATGDLLATNRIGSATRRERLRQARRPNTLSPTINVFLPSIAGKNQCTRENLSNRAVVRRVPVENYVRQVLGCESDPRWPLEAMKAQAIAIRSYAIFNTLNPKASWMRNCQAHLTSDIYSQDYLCRENPADQRYNKTDPTAIRNIRDRAVNATTGQILVAANSGNVIEAMYANNLATATPHWQGMYQEEIGSQAESGMNHIQILLYAYGAGSNSTSGAAFSTISNPLLSASLSALVNANQTTPNINTINGYAATTNSPITPVYVAPVPETNTSAWQRIAAATHGLPTVTNPFASRTATTRLNTTDDATDCPDKGSICQITGYNLTTIKYHVQRLLGSSTTDHDCPLYGRLTCTKNNILGSFFGRECAPFDEGTAQYGACINNQENKARKQETYEKWLAAKTEREKAEKVAAEVEESTKTDNGELIAVAEQNECKLTGVQCRPANATGVCANGFFVCKNKVDECEAAQPQVETCNNIDDDCDGTIDNVPGGCESVVSSTCQPQEETCNNLDDDCDGFIDEGDLGSGEPCTLETPGVDGQTQGTIYCVKGGTLACRAIAPSSAIPTDQLEIARQANAKFAADQTDNTEANNAKSIVACSLQPSGEHGAPPKLPLAYLLGCALLVARMRKNSKRAPSR